MYKINNKSQTVALNHLNVGKSMAMSAIMLLGAVTAIAPAAHAAGDLKTGFVPGRSYCNNFVVPNLTSNGTACITLTTNSANKEDVETMLFFTNDSGAKVNATTTLNVDGAAQNGSTSATFNPGVPTRTGWKTTASVSSPASTVEAVFTVNGQVIDSVSGQ